MQYFSNVDYCVILEVAIAHDVNAILRFAQLRSAAQPGPTRYHPPDSGCELHRGDFLTDFALHDSPEWDAWARDRREYYRRQALAALGTITQYQLDNGNIAAIASARRRIAIDVWEETAYQQLFLALARSGQRATALIEYEALRQRLEVDLAVQPSQATESLIDRIRQGNFDMPASALSPQPAEPVQARSTPPRPVLCAA
jgi:DNA-binding SARP family transcriptional activator